ncbi:MAG: protecting protein DprA, partial [Pseudonocardiales bacterium]|nr:protecting protein DprA [Pseudonocardiales bacterium]
CVDDVLTVVGGIGEASAGSPSTPAADSDVRAELDALDPVARRVFDGLAARRPAGPDEIALRSGVSTLEVIRALPVLELASLVEATDAGYRIAGRLRTGRAPRPATDRNRGR